MKNMVSQLNANTGLLFAKKKGTSKRTQSISSELQSMSSFKDADQFYSKLQTLVIGTMGKFRAGFRGEGGGRRLFLIQGFDTLPTLRVSTL